MERVFLIILDGFGGGDLPDADRYGDRGSNTLGGIIEHAGDLELPELNRLGLGRIPGVRGLDPPPEVTGCWGRMAQRSAGKDTTTGHWELAGLVLKEPFPTYREGFPSQVIGAFREQTGRDVLGNRAASGTEIIEELGREHMETGRPIVYTSVDSVFQIAAHKGTIPLEELYDLCRTARKILTGEHAVARVIARPFEGEPGSFERTGERKDFSLPPPEPTLLDHLLEAGVRVTGVGKIGNIFAGLGLTDSHPTGDNREGMERTLELAAEGGTTGLIFTNLVDFDSLYGHRRDPEGYARALMEFDAFLPRLFARLGPGDMLIVTSDHGCDPTFHGTDHTREYVPLLIWGSGLKEGVCLGTRDTMADLAATVARVFDARGTGWGTSFFDRIVAG